MARRLVPERPGLDGQATPYRELESLPLQLGIKMQAFLVQWTE